MNIKRIGAGNRMSKAVVHGGKVVAEMPAEGADRAEIGRLMAGDH